MPNDDVLLRISRVSERGLVQIPLEIRRKLDLTPGTMMVIIATEDALVLRKGAWRFTKESPPGLLRKIRKVFSKMPLRKH